MEVELAGEKRVMFLDGKRTNRWSRGLRERVMAAGRGVRGGGNDDKMGFAESLEQKLMVSSEKRFVSMSTLVKTPRLPYKQHSSLSSSGC